jgi:hypothetical protein
MITSKTA